MYRTSEKSHFGVKWCWNRPCLGLVLPIRVYLNPKPFFLAIFYYRNSCFFNHETRILKKTLELLLHSNITNSDNAEVVEWRV